MVKDTLLSQGFLPKFLNWIEIQNHLIKSFEIKTKDLTLSGFASMSMTVDTAIRIVLHSAEVVQLYPHDTISLVYLASVDTTAHYLRQAV